MPIIFPLINDINVELHAVQRWCWIGSTKNCRFSEMKHIKHDSIILVSFSIVMVFSHLDSLETQDEVQLIQSHVFVAPSARFGDLLGLRGQKHSEAQRNSGYPQVVPCNGRETERCRWDFGHFLLTHSWKTIAAGENVCTKSEKHQSYCIKSNLYFF